MRTVAELHDTATAYYIRHLGGEEKFKGYLDAMRHYGEITEKQKHDLVEAVDRAFERCAAEVSENVKKPADAPKSSHPLFLTAAQVSEITGISKWTIYHLARRNRIPHHRPEIRKVLFDRDEVTKWMRGYKADNI